MTVLSMFPKNHEFLTTIRSYFLEGNSVSFPERYSAWENLEVNLITCAWVVPGWRGFVLMRRFVTYWFAQLTHGSAWGFSSRRDKVLNLLYKRKSYKLIQVCYASTHFEMYLNILDTFNNITTTTTTTATTTREHLLYFHNFKRP